MLTRNMYILVVLIFFIRDVTGLLEFSKSLQDVYTIRTLQDISIETCKLACESRQRCKSAIYYRDAYHCILTSNDALTNSTVVRKGTVLLSGFHSPLDQNGSYSSCGGQTCLPEETCSTKTQGNQVCEITECQNPQGLLPKGAKIEGNIYTVGSKLRVGCEHHMETIQCKSDGNWTNSSSIAVLDLDCTDLQGCSGVYPTLQNYQVHCDMDTDQGHWLVFQRRIDGSVNFYRNWTDYKNGFGDIHGEFWLGLEHVHEIVQNGDYELRIDMENYLNEKRFAKFSTFNVDDEANNYTLTVSGYSGDAGDQFYAMNGKQFSTFDKDNDNLAQNCAVVHMGAWWYGVWDVCYICNLNGLYGDGLDGSSKWKLIHWNSWTASGRNDPLRITEMKIRRK